jgi:glycosyltransferase 2 family protein
MTDVGEAPKEYQLPKSALKWVAVGLVLTTSVVVVISLFSGVTIADLAKLGYLPFGLAASVTAARLLVQIVRFRVLVNGLAVDPKPRNLVGLPLARVASEFVSLSTPATSMGVFVRTAWLSGKGVDSGTALWIGYFEVLIEIYVGGSLAIVAAAIAFLRGAVIIGFSILLVTLLLVAGYTTVFIIPALKNIKIPHRLFSIAAFFVGGPRATALYLRAVVGSLNFSLSARAILNRRNTPVVFKAVGLTIVEDLLAGTALWLVLSSAGLKIDPFSTSAVYWGVAAIAVIPVTIGGAGITELTMQAFLTSVYGFSSWPAVLLWRIATYQVLLAITGIVFLLFVRKSMKQSPKSEQKT